MSEEHRELAMNIKNIHKDLRSLSALIGYEEAWKHHMKDEETRQLYAKSMKQLAEKHWKNNSSSEDRIQWSASFCDSYFVASVLERWRLKDLRSIDKLIENGMKINPKNVKPMLLDEKLKILDVGSSGNFFKKFERFEILPLDISPSDDSVFTCDFLSVPIENHLKLNEKIIEALPAEHFHVVFFCLLLEYLPSSVQRIKCCEKAFELLKTQGILIIITPDSSHEMKNSKQIKNWRWTLSKIGFARIKVEKLMNLTCMAFRKSVAPEVPQKWADTHSDNMEFEMIIPQDKTVKLENGDNEELEFDAELMKELAQYE